MLVAYRGYSVIMFAPVAALFAVLLTDPSYVLPMFSGIFMEKMVGFVKLYFPVFMLGVIGSIFILIVGLTYLEWRRRQAAAKGEGYGTGHINEPEPVAQEKLANPLVALLPLVLVGVMNKVFTSLIPEYFGKSFTVPLPGHPLTVQVSS